MSRMTEGGKEGEGVLDDNSRQVMVGASRFERPTSRTPSECATGLRYAPTMIPFPGERLTLFSGS